MLLFHAVPACRRDIPTLRAVKEEERRAAGVADDNDNDDDNDNENENDDDDDDDNENDVPPASAILQLFQDPDGMHFEFPYELFVSKRARATCGGTTPPFSAASDDGRRGSGYQGSCSFGTGPSYFWNVSCVSQIFKF